MKCIRDNTAFDIVEDNAYYAPFEQIRYEFQALTRIIGKNPAKSPSWLAYQKLVYDLSLSIANEGRMKPDEAKTLGRLGQEISALGRGAVKTLHRSKTATQVRMEDWLRSVNIRAEWQGPFKDIFDRSLQLGVEEVQAYALQKWSQLSGEFYRPLSTRFPFDRDSKTVVDSELLKSALHPQGQFWTEFESFLSPLLENGRTGWKPRATEGVDIKLPTELFVVANRMREIRTLLWNAKGKEKALSITLRSLPFPTTKTEAQPVMAALQVGAENVFAFNQKPQWQTIEVDWWSQEPARLSVGFERYGQSNRAFAGVASGGEQWSFFDCSKRHGKPT